VKLATHMCNVLCWMCVSCKFEQCDTDVYIQFLDPWVSMEDEYSLMPKRSSNIWKKNQDADLMRIGKRSAFNDDMMRMGKRFSMEDDTRFGK